MLKMLIMKKSINCISFIIFALSLNTCSANIDNSDYLVYPEFESSCPSFTDAVKFPEPWDLNAESTFTIPNKTIKSMSSCGLLITLLEYLSIRSYEYGGDFLAPRVTIINNYLRANKVALELFSRNDFFLVIESTYQSVMTIKGYINSGIEVGAVNIFCLEMLLSSEMNMTALKKEEKIKLMNMALERTKYAVNLENIEPCMIMIAIMKSFKFDPFLKDIEPKLVETSFGYTMTESDGNIHTNILNSHHRDIIIDYSNQFLNDQNFTL